jgi:hypothetical protein
LLRIYKSTPDPYPTITFLSTLVDLGLVKVGDLLGTVLDLAVGSLEAAQNAGTLGDVVVADQLVVGNAVESTVACWITSVFSSVWEKRPSRLRTYTERGHRARTCQRHR